MITTASVCESSLSLELAICVLVLAIALPGTVAEAVAQDTGIGGTTASAARPAHD